MNNLYLYTTGVSHFNFSIENVEKIPIDFNLTKEYILKHNNYERIIPTQSGTNLGNSIVNLFDDSKLIRDYDNKLASKINLNDINKNIKKYETEIEEYSSNLENQEDFLNDNCPICLNQFYKFIDQVVTLGCGCYYCKTCISNCDSNKCPKCTKQFLKESIDKNRMIENIFKNDLRVTIYKKIKKLEDEKDANKPDPIIEYKKKQYLIAKEIIKAKYPELINLLY